MKQLQDNDPCPVNGQHLGKPIAEVPASFLDWLVGQKWCDAKYPTVVDYVRRNRKAIDQDLRAEGLID